MPHPRARLLLRALEERITPMAGQLDPSFGVGGLVTTRFSGPSSDYANATVIDNAGRILVAGYADVGGQFSIAVSRYLTSGAIDVTFGNQGIAIVNAGASFDYAYGMSLDSSQRIVIAGATRERAIGVFDYNCVVMRLTENGMLDSTFNGTGIRTVGFGPTEDQARAVAIDSQDRVVIAGFSNKGTGNEIAVARITADGKLDLTFDADGQKTISWGTDAKANAVVIDSSDRILIAGHAIVGSNKDMAVVRLNTDGAIELQRTIVFGSYEEVANAIALDSLGRILVAGYRKDEFSFINIAVARLTSVGTLDSSFSGDGLATFPGWAVNGMAVDASDQPIIVGSGTGSNDFRVCRLTVGGNIQNADSFDLSGEYDGTTSVAVDFLNRIVAVGVAASPSPDDPGNDVGLIRLTSTFAPDVTFDGDGVKIHDWKLRSESFAGTVVVDYAGRVIVSGSSPGPDNKSRFTVCRYLPNGELDATFGDLGRAMFEFTGYASSAGRFVIDPMGRLVAVGLIHNSGGSFVLRLTSSGILDTTFGVEGKFSAPNGVDLGDVIIDPLNRLLLSATTFNGSNDDMAIVRLSSNGTLDPSFDSDGIVTIDFGSMETGGALVSDSLGRIIVSGPSGDVQGLVRDFAVARLNANGMLDGSFDSDGRQIIDFGSAIDEPWGHASDSQDRIVIAGSTGNGQDRLFAVARLNVDGQLDASFDSDGQKTFGIHKNNSVATCLAVDSQDRINVAGFSGLYPYIDFGIARLESNGDFDNSFGTSGKQSISFGTDTDIPQGMGFDSFGRVLLAGTVRIHGTVIGIARLTGDSPPSKLSSITINDGSPQRSMITSLKVTFDSKVSFVGPPAAAFQLNRQSDNAAVNLAANVDPSGTFVTLTFTGGAVDGISLADGRYSLRIYASQFAGLGFDGNGNGLANLSPADDFVFASAATPNPPTNIYRIFGDANGDGNVAANDFIIFRLFFNGVNPTFDFDNDGAVAANDFTQFRLRFGGSI